MYLNFTLKVLFNYNLQLRNIDVDVTHPPLYIALHM